MTYYQSQEEHDYFECGEETVIGERSISMEERDKQIRAEERAKVLSEVEKIITEVEAVNESNGRYNACQELRAKLNQLKGKNDTR